MTLMAGLVIRLGMRSERIGSGRSSAVNTACTPGSASAGAASMAQMRACACGLRTKQANSASASLTSSTKRPAPMSSAGSSSRLTRAPNCRAPMSALLAQPAGGVERRRHDAGVAGAAAQVAGQRLAHVGLARIAVVAQELGERHQHAGRAEAALQAVIVLERLLQRVEHAVGGKPFHRGDLADIYRSEQRRVGDEV